MSCILLSGEASIKLQYRADIDGLRAIAILSVVFYHAFRPIFPGGYVGVDIFFVISGFLISSILMESLRNNKFSFIGFYVRRINRLFPALILVFLALIVAGWLELFHQEYESLSKYILAGIFFVSNFVLWEETGYFDMASESKPLLHFWSLAIEEQFYILWPLLLWLAWKKRFSFLFLIGALAFLSFGYHIKLTYTDLNGAFYSPFSRSWELLLGAALACLNSDKAPSKAMDELKSIAGLGLILLGFIYNEQGMNDWWWLLPPTVGTALAISAGPKAFLNRHLLSNRYIVGIGLISYPLYLWHWPLLSFAHIGLGEPILHIQASLVIVSFFLAAGTYLFVEKPLRKKYTGNNKAIALVASMLVIAGIALSIKLLDGVPQRLSLPTLTQTNPFIPECQNQRCEYGNLDSKKTIVLIGDSSASHYGKALRDTLGKNFKIVSVTENGCMISKSYPAKQSKDCESTYEQVSKMNEPNVYAMIRAQRWEAYFQTGSEVKQLIQEASNAYGMNPQKIILIGTTLDNDFACEVSKFYDIRFFQKTKCTPFENSKQKNKLFFKVAREMDLPSNLHLIDLAEIFCPQGQCQYIENGVSNYIDTMHLSKEGALKVIPEIKKAFSH